MIAGGKPADRVSYFDERKCSRGGGNGFSGGMEDGDLGDRRNNIWNCEIMEFNFEHSNRGRGGVEADRGGLLLFTFLFLCFKTVKYLEIWQKHGMLIGCQVLKTFHKFTDLYWQKKLFNNQSVLHFSKIIVIK